MLTMCYVSVFFPKLLYKSQHLNKENTVQCDTARKNHECSTLLYIVWALISSGFAQFQNGLRDMDYYKEAWLL